jgi:hypothetical protein
MLIIMREIFGRENCKTLQIFSPAYRRAAGGDSGVAAADLGLDLGLRAGSSVRAASISITLLREI